MPAVGTAAVDTGDLSRLPAGPILMRLRRLLITGAAAAVVYTVLSTGSVGTCSDGNGSSAPTGGAQVTCANLVVHPSWVMYAVFAAIVFVAVGRVARRAASVVEAVRILDRAATLIVALALVAGAIGLLWMMLVPRDALTSGATLVYPFPFSSPELTVTHSPDAG